MTTHSLTTTAAEVMEAEDEERIFLITAGDWNDSKRTIYIRFSDTGQADVLIYQTATGMQYMRVPKGRPIWAWTSYGTATLGLYKQPIAHMLVPCPVITDKRE